MPRPHLTYALPVSCLAVRSTLTTTHDTVLGGEPATARRTSVALHVHGLVRDQGLEIETGAIRDTALSLELTDDGRLASAHADSTGQLGKVVIAVVGAGATAAALLTGAAPLAAATVAAVGAGTGREVAPANLPTPTAATPEGRVAAGYRERFPASAAARERYLAATARAADRLATLATAITGEATETERSAGYAEARRLRSLLVALRAELCPLDEHFAAWRASTITTHVAQRQRCFSLDALRGAGVSINADGRVAFAPGAHESIRFAWDTLGVTAVMDPAGRPSTVPAATRTNSILVRLPRRTRLSIYENVDGRAVLREERPYLVVDSACETQELALRRSLWGKRSTTLAFSGLGVVTRYGQGSTSSAAAVADAASASSEALRSGVEHAEARDEPAAEHRPA